MGTTSGVVGRFKRRRHARREVDGLRTALKRSELYLQAAPAFLVVLDREQRVRLINAHGCRVLGYTEAELLGRNWYDVAVAPRDRERLRGSFMEIMNGGRHVAETVESTLLTRDGEERTISWRRTLIHDERGRVAATLSAGEDVTERRRAERALAHLTFHDRLTGLPNRLAFEDRLATAVARARTDDDVVAVLYVDLEDFGAVNDSLGHRGGDELLRQVAHRLRDAARTGETVARHGGDEFLVLLERLPAAVAEDVALATAERFGAVLEPPFRVRDTDLEIAAAFGASLLPGDAETPEELLAHADTAMYEAKRRRAGPRRYAATRPAGADRLELRVRLRRALDAGDLVTYLQPIVEPASGRRHGFEALVRWHDPHRGVVPPSVFIPYAERTGLIEAVGRRVVDLACAHLATLEDDAWVSINVSTRELEAPAFAGTIAAALDRHGVEPASLLVEVTESAVVEDADRAGAAIAALRAMGVRLAIDDFGAAYSSLTRLRELPVDVLKIDAGFLEGVPADRDASAMLSAVIDLARGLGLTPVAEGVETDEQRQTLVDLGCPLAQGYLLGRPAPPQPRPSAAGAHA